MVLVELTYHLKKLTIPEIMYRIPVLFSEFFWICCFGCDMILSFLRKLVLWWSLTLLNMVILLDGFLFHPQLSLSNLNILPLSVLSTSFNTHASSILHNTSSQHCLLTTSLWAHCLPKHYIFTLDSIWRSVFFWRCVHSLSDLNHYHAFNTIYQPTAPKDIFPVKTSLFSFRSLCAILLEITIQSAPFRK